MKLINVISIATQFANILETSHCASVALLQSVNDLVKCQKPGTDFEQLAKEFGEAVYEKTEGLGVSPATLKVYVSQARRVIRSAAQPDARKIAANTETQGLGLQAAAKLMPVAHPDQGRKPGKVTKPANSGAGEAVEFVKGEAPKVVQSGLDVAVDKLRKLAARDANMESLLLLVAKHAEHAEQISNWLVTAKLGSPVRVAERVLKAA